MANLADMTLRVARLVTDVIEGNATAGTEGTLTDAVALIQGNQFFDRGTLWVLTGDNAGLVTRVMGFGNNQITFTAQTDPIAEDDRYAVARGIYPYNNLISAVQEALRETFVLAEAVSEPPLDIVGDGATLAFTIPSGASKVAIVELEDPNDATNTFQSTHWREMNGNLTFTEGFAPPRNWIVHIYTRQEHPILTAPADIISSQISEEWLRWKAAEYALYWGVGIYGEAKEYRIEERMNRVLGKLKGMIARAPLVIVRTAGD